VSFSENILRPFFPGITDHKFLQLMRVVLVAFTVHGDFLRAQFDAPIYKMVENAYKVTLVGAFVPLVCGLYWKRASNLGALLARSSGSPCGSGWSSSTPMASSRRSSRASSRASRG
jgi:Na+(H+)/acetate symporter ActP